MRTLPKYSSEYRTEAESICQFFLNTLAVELLWGNSTGLRYTTFSIFTQYADLRILQLLQYAGVSSD